MKTFAILGSCILAVALLAALAPAEKQSVPGSETGEFVPVPVAPSDFISVKMHVSSLQALMYGVDDSLLSDPVRREWAAAASSPLTAPVYSLPPAMMRPRSDEDDWDEPRDPLSRLRVQDPLSGLSAPALEEPSWGWLADEVTRQEQNRQSGSDSRRSNADRRQDSRR